MWKKSLKSNLWIGYFVFRYVVIKAFIWSVLKNVFDKLNILTSQKVLKMTFLRSNKLYSQTR